MKNFYLKFIFHIIFIFSTSIIFFSCEYGSPLYRYSDTSVDSRASSIKILQGEELPQIESNLTTYSFLIITDSHFGTKKATRYDEQFLKKFEELLSNENPSLIPRFIVNLGDSLNAGYEKEAALYNETAQKWIEKAKKILNVNDYKIYSILGNHDLFNNGWHVWKENFWPYTSYYKFSLKENSENQKFSFYFLDSGNGTLGALQFEDLEENLKSDSAPKIIFCHYPIYADGQPYFSFDDIIERNRLIANYAKYNVKYVFEGHFHPSNDCYDFKKFKELVVASYIYKRNAVLVTVDETTESIEHKFINY